MQRARQVFLLYVVENGLTIVVAFALGRHSVAGLTASVSIGYSVTAVAALAVLAHYRVRVAPVIWSVHMRRTLTASLAATAAIVLVYATSGATHGAGLVARFSAALVLGAVAYVVAVVLGQRRAARHRSKDARLGTF